jgi:hypothetical protein
MDTPEQIAEHILDQILRQQGIGIDDIAAIVRAYGDARARAERERIISLIQTEPPPDTAPDAEPA